MNFRDAYEFEPETYQGQSTGGLLGMFHALMAPRAAGTESVASRSDGTEYNSNTYDNRGRGLIGRLRELQEQQNAYQPPKPAMNSRRFELAQAITNASRNLGIDPQDLATAISYETGGTFNHNVWGGGGGNYFGLIQFGPPERETYGVKEGQSITEQMQAVEHYLRDRGLKPGKGLLDIYSTINTGSPGHYNRTDAQNGGAPGTVADKVNSQMEGHKANAAGLLKQYARAVASQPPFSVPPTFPEHADPVFPQQAAPQPERALVRKSANVPNPASIAPLSGGGLTNDPISARQPLLGLVSGKPMQYLGMPIFDRH